jgi:hypothetical protein
MRGDGRGLIFPWPLTMESLWMHYGQILRSAGLPYSRRHKFHAMRKTVASMGAARGFDPSALLRHADPRVTKMHYLDPTIAIPVQASDILPRPAGSSPVRRLTVEAEGGAA